jgi:hypothetical protein
MLERSYRSFVLTAGIAAMVTLLCMVCVNASLDPYYDFAYLAQRKASPPRTVNGFAELKYKLVLREELRTGSAIVLVGSSVTAGIAPDDHAFNSPSLYNLAFSGASIYQIERFLETLSGINRTLEVYVGLDFFGARRDASPDLTYVGEEAGLYRIDALARLADPVTTLDAWLGRADSGITFALRGWRIFTQPRPAAADHKPSERYWRNYYRDFELDPDYSRRLQRIKGMFEKVTFFINPLYISHYRLLRESGLDDLYCQWQAQIHAAVPLFDFSFAKMSADPKSFTDSEHYTSQAGFQLLRTMTAPDAQFDAPVAPSEYECHSRFAGLTSITH